MTMQDLYDHMKESLGRFDLRFNQMDEVQVEFGAEGITFRAEVDGVKIAISKDWK